MRKMRLCQSTGWTRAPQRLRPPDQVNTSKLDHSTKDYVLNVTFPEGNRPVIYLQRRSFIVTCHQLIQSQNFNRLPTFEDQGNCPTYPTSYEHQEFARYRKMGVQ